MCCSFYQPSILLQLFPHSWRSTTNPCPLLIAAYLKKILLSWTMMETTAVCKTQLNLVDSMLPPCLLLIPPFLPTRWYGWARASLRKLLQVPLKLMFQPDCKHQPPICLRPVHNNLTNPLLVREKLNHIIFRAIFHHIVQFTVANQSTGLFFFLLCVIVVVENPATKVEPLNDSQIPSYTGAEHQYQVGIFRWTIHWRS